MTVSNRRIQNENAKFQEVAPNDIAVKNVSLEDRLVVSSLDSLTGVASLGAAGTGLALDIDHKEGQYSVEIDKVADGAIKVAGISNVIDLALSRFSDGKISYWVNVSSLTDIASVSLQIGTDASNCNVYTTADSGLSTGWNELSYDCNAPTSSTGNGCIWGNVDYIDLFVTFDAAADTLADIRWDAITISNPLKAQLVAGDVNIGDVDAVCTNIGVFPVQASSAAIASGGVSTLFDADGDNVKAALSAAPANLYSIVAYNENAVPAWVQIWDLAAGDVTVGATAPKVSFFVPAQGAYHGDFNFPISCATAITYACTTTDNGAGDPTVGLVVNFMYKA